MSRAQDVRFNRILAAILIISGVGIAAVVITPRYMPDHQSSRYSRALADMRSYATAIETFAIDTGEYPLSTTNPQEMLPFPGAPDGISSFRIFTATKKDSFPRLIMGYNKMPSGTPMTLTTPIPYFTKYEEDRSNLNISHPFAYYSNKDGYIFWSPGRDGKYDIINPAKYAYDASNGTNSRGDLYRVKPGPDASTATQ